MIRYKNDVYEDYFIDPVTAVITDVDGNVIEQKINNGYAYVWLHKTQMYVHRMMAHTYLGYNSKLVVDHIDEDKLNNALTNLQYLTRGRNVAKSSTGRPMPPEIRQHLHNVMVGRKPSEKTMAASIEYHTGTFWWVNEQGELKHQRECPGDGWQHGKIYRKDLADESN